MWLPPPEHHLHTRHGAKCFVSIEVNPLNNLRGGLTLLHSEMWEWQLRVVKSLAHNVNLEPEFTLGKLRQHQFRLAIPPPPHSDLNGIPAHSKDGVLFTSIFQKPATKTPLICWVNTHYLGRGNHPLCQIPNTLLRR